MKQVPLFRNRETAGTTLLSISIRRQCPANCTGDKTRAFSVQTYCIDNAPEDVVAWVLVLVVLISVRVGYLRKLKKLEK